jgi:hypothetical protein
LSEDRKKFSNPFLRFVWLRCHGKIKHRLAADEAMLGVPLFELLERWELSDSDVVEDHWFMVSPPMHDHFVDLSIRYRLEHGSRLYLFSRSTIPSWCRMFIDTLAALKTYVKDCGMQSASIEQLVLAISTLNHLFYDNRAFEMLLALPPLHDAVEDAMFTTERSRRKKRSGEYLQKESFVLFIYLF